MEDFYLFIIWYEVGLSVLDYQPIYDSEDVCKYISKHIRIRNCRHDSKENLTLRVFIDNSIVEVFANERQAISRRVYPEKKGNGISLFPTGKDINVKSFKSWEIMPSNPY